MYTFATERTGPTRTIQQEDTLKHRKRFAIVSSCHNIILIDKRSKGDFVVGLPGGNVTYYMCKCALVCIHLYT